jgi:hypothetical protein
MKLYSQLVGIWIGLCLVAAAATASYVDSRQTQAHQNDALRAIICAVDQREQASTTLTPAQKRAAGAFWVQALEQAHLRRCFEP